MRCLPSLSYVWWAETHTGVGLGGVNLKYERGCERTFGHDCKAREKNSGALVQLSAFGHVTNPNTLECASDIFSTSV